MCIHHFARYKTVCGMKRNLKTYLNSIFIFFMSLSVFHDFKTPQMSFEKP